MRVPFFGEVGFYHAAIAVSVVMFACSLAVILYLVYNTSAGGGGDGRAFPPVQSACPDLWTLNDENKLCQIDLATGSNKKDNTEKNVGSLVDATSGAVLTDSARLTDLKNLYASSLKTADDKITFNPNDSTFSDGKPAVCGRKQFAAITGIHWEGVSNSNQCEMFANQSDHIP